MPLLTRRRAVLIALAPVLAPGARRALAAATAPQVHAGTYALPDGQAAVAATLLTERVARTPSRVLDVGMTELSTGRPVTRYQTELTKQLHVIAVSEDWRTFLHEHGERPDARGRFRVAMAFPRGGRWHVYADAVPAGRGQQVFRFDVDIGGSGNEAASGGQLSPRPAPPPTGLEGRDGRYAVRFDSLDLRAGQEAELRLRVLRDGSPAGDLSPYLGVAAHAVFIAASDLSYVHVHAAPTAAPAAGGTGAAMRHDMTGHPGAHAAHGAHAGHSGPHGGGGAPLRGGVKVPPDLVLHVRAPKAGTYALWLQFMAGGQVRTVPFTVTVA